MKSILLFALVVSFMAVSLFAQDTANDVEAIKSVIQSAYVDGLQNEGDAAKIDAGFEPGFNLLGIGKDGSMWKYPIDVWKKDVLKNKEEGKLPKNEDEKVTVKFLNVDVTGTAGVAKIEFFVGTKLKYVDYISCYKFGEEWKIVNKIFYKFPEK